MKKPLLSPQPIHLVISVAALILFSIWAMLPEEEVVQESEEIPSINREPLDLDAFGETVFSLKSTTYDKEVEGLVVSSRNEISYHIFDFINKVVTQRSLLDGEWIEFSFPMKSMYQINGIAGTTFVIEVQTLGLKEVWFSFDVGNLGYDYDDGSRISCYGISRVVE